jgi:quinol monooxygenase YgiN
MPVVVAVKMRQSPAREQLLRTIFGVSILSIGRSLMIHVLAQIQTIPGHRDAFLAEFAQVAILVRQEAGCLEYGAAVDVDTGIPVQTFLGDHAVLIVEKWESIDHLKAHLVAPHMTDYRVRIKPFVESVRLQVLEPRA